MKFDFIYFLESFPFFLKYVHITLGITFLAMTVSLALGTFIALLSNTKSKSLKTIIYLYLSFFRGTPLLVQLFVFYFGLPQIFPFMSAMNAFTAAWIGMSLYNSAYVAEIMRGALSSVDRSQMDASLASGLTRWQGMRHVIIPQATRVAVPALGNNFIGLLKSSSLAFTLGVSEILAMAKSNASISFKFLENFLAVALLYWLITVIFTIIQKRIEKKMNAPYV